MPKKSEYTSAGTLHRGIKKITWEAAKPCWNCSEVRNLRDDGRCEECHDIDRQIEEYQQVQAAINACRCGSGEWSYWVYDAQGIELFKACEKCEKKRLRDSGYRPEIISGYDQSDVDEPIEPESY